MSTKTLVPFLLLPKELLAKLISETEPDGGTLWEDENGTMYEYASDLCRWFKITPTKVTI